MIDNTIIETGDAYRSTIASRDLLLENEQACINKETVFANQFAMSFEDEDNNGNSLGRVYIPRILLTENATGMKIDPNVTERYIVFDFKIKIKKKVYKDDETLLQESLFKSRDTYESYSHNSFIDEHITPYGELYSSSFSSSAPKEYKYPKIGDRFLMKRRFLHRDETSIPTNFYVVVIKVHNRHLIENYVTGRYKIETSKRYGVVEMEIEQGELKHNRSIISSYRNRKYDIDWLTPA